MSKLRTRNLSNATFLWNLVFALTLLVYAVGLFIPIMEPDAAVYAQVSMEMHDRDDFFSIYHKGVDWLDKPHFPFWMSALSFKIFGVNTFAYKLPAVIFVLLGAFYTYLFGKRYYSAQHGWIAVIILITAEHIIISNQDVRAEPFMTGLMIMGLYHLSALVRGRRGEIKGRREKEGERREKREGEMSPTGDLVSAVGGPALLPGSVAESRRSYETGVDTEHATAKHIILGSLACACLIMTKGLFTIIPIAAGIGLALIYSKQWKEIFHWKWLTVLIVTAIFLSPAIYGYYQQFDRHPEKVVFGETNVSGVKFFLWTSQWGRFTNTGPIKGKGDITFFVHTVLWAFLPWAFAGFFALFSKTRELVKKITYGENFTFFGFITLFLIFSASRFQLSFYLNPIFPLLAVLTAAVLLRQGRRTLKTFATIHFVLSILLVTGLVGLHYLFSADVPHVDTLIIVAGASLIGFYVFTRRNSYLKKIIFGTAMLVLGVNYYLNREFYPSLLNYQAESEAASYMKQNNINASDVVFADEMESVGDVILHAPTRVIAVDSLRADDVRNKYLFTTTEGKAKLDSLGLSYEAITQFEDFPVTRLTGKFIDRKTRHKEVKEKFLLKVGE